MKRGLGTTITLALAFVLSITANAADEKDTIFPEAPKQSPVQLIPGEVSAGVEASLGYCPCFRFTVRTQKLGGRIETKNFIISSEALFRFKQSMSPLISEMMVASRYVTVGTMEVMLKGGSVGLGFDGVTIGDDKDLSYSELVRSGLYVLVNLIQSEALQLNVRHGYQFEQMRVNMAPNEIHNSLPQSLILNWDAGIVSGNITGTVSFDPTNITDLSEIQYTASTNVRVGGLHIKSLVFGVSIEGRADYDPFRKAHGLEPGSLSAGVFIDAAYIPRSRYIKGKGKVPIKR